MRNLALTFGLAATLIVGLSSSSLAEEKPKELKISTTTSVEASGLVKVILPEFEKRFGYKTSVIAVGTGAALKLAEDGNVDVTIVHSKQAEDAFLAKGFGVNRRELWYNDFVIIGPAADPAGIAKTKTAAETFGQIAAKKALFISRADKSGTHDRELSIWAKAGIKPAGDWYVETGSGMGAVLIMANERAAYTITDRATYLTFKDKIGLVILSAGDPILLNTYAIIAVNPDRYPQTNYIGAMALIAWLSSPEGQKLAASLVVGGERLFNPLGTPNAK